MHNLLLELRISLLRQVSYNRQDLYTSRPHALQESTSA